MSPKPWLRIAYSPLRHTYTLPFYMLSRIPSHFERRDWVVATVQYSFIVFYMLARTEGLLGVYKIGQYYTSGC